MISKGIKIVTGRLNGALLFLGGMKDRFAIFMRP
jgi:hypothetical protein